jgi:hypothetical protein
MASALTRSRQKQGGIPGLVGRQEGSQRRTGASRQRQPEVARLPLVRARARL